MNKDKYVFAQLVQFLDRSKFNRIVAKYHGVDTSGIKRIVNERKAVVGWMKLELSILVKVIV